MTLREKFNPKKSNIDFKAIEIKIISAKLGNDIIIKNHYSGTSVKGVKYHIGVYYFDKIVGVAQYGYGIMPSKSCGWVADTLKDEFLELNRLWVDDILGFNAESYIIAKTLKFVKKQDPKLKWIISFADGMMGKNGIIYQASNFVYTGFRKDGGIWYTNNGERLHSVSLWHKHKTIERRVLEGIYGIPLYKVFGGQYRYFYFFNRKLIKNLNVDILPYPKNIDIKKDIIVKTKYGINNHCENLDDFYKLLNSNNGKSKKNEKDFNKSFHQQSLFEIE